MASPTFYDFSIGYATNVLAALTAILKKAESHSSAASFPTSRIHPDMLALDMQVFFVTNVAQQMLARCSGTEPLKLERDMKTFDDFYARIKQVTDLIASADKEKINANASKTSSIGFGPSKNVDMVISSYVSGYAVPNLFFHVTTAYNIVRKEGVDVGKMDYLNCFLGEYALKN